VDNIENSAEHYSGLFGKDNVSSIVSVESQKVKVCFVKIGDGSYIELVQPLSEESVVYKLLKKKVSYYHIAYKVEDIPAAVARLEEMNYKPLEFFNSEAFEGKRCIFLFSPDAHLIELVEQ
jgi:hypothetical protein